MDMQVDSQLIRNERLKRAWSQEQLAQVSGLGIRTVQRVESGGNASLETVKALSAVLELPVETLLVDTPPSLANPSSPSRPSLFKPWRAFAAGCLTTFITMGGIVSMQGALAEEIALDFSFSLNDEEVANKVHVSGEAGEEAVVRIEDGMSLHFTPSITNEGHILIKVKIYNGQNQIIAAPSITTLNGQRAVMKVGRPDENGRFLGIEMEITPTIE